jgi:23S rRNA (adenine2030-N6)-methyltransferase
MLSYQHAYHAGSLTDVHKHAALACALEYLTRKDKPLSYIETHAGRGLYDLGSAEARKTGEAAAGIQRDEVARWFSRDHAYTRALAAVRGRFGEGAYPGSPLIAATLLRRADVLHLAELHPQEHAALRAALPRRANLYAQDGFRMAAAVCPPTPRRGLLLCDPSYEVKAEYTAIPAFFAEIHRKWNAGILMLWYPILEAGRHEAMTARLSDLFPTGLCHEVGFPPLRDTGGIGGSGLFLVNPPYGLEAELARLAECFTALTRSREGS